MAEKNQQVYPLAPAVGYPRSDQESYPSYQTNELRKKKRMKCLAYIAIFAIFQTAIILVFALTIMKVKSPKVRLERVRILDGITNGTKRLSAQVIVKNTNFGHYKFESETATLAIEGGTTTMVGQFVIPEARARARSTKRIDILVDVNGGGSSGVVEVRGRTRLRGKVVLMKVLKRKKNADMDCILSIDFARNEVQSVNCR